MYVSPTLSEQLLRLHFRGRIGETTRLGGEMKKRVISNRKKTKKQKNKKRLGANNNYDGNSKLKLLYTS